MKKAFILSSLALAAPFVAGAQEAVNFNYLDKTVEMVAGIITALIPIVLALAVLLFIWGLVTYILKAGDPEGREGAKSQMIWGVIIIFVIVSLWGLVGILQNITGTDKATADNELELPTFEGGSIVPTP